MPKIMTKVFAGIFGGVFPGGGTPADPVLQELKAAAVSLWTLDEASGNFIDLIADNDLAVSGGTVQRITGKVGNATRSDAGILVATASVGIFPADAPITIAFWFNPYSPNFQGIMGGRYSGNGHQIIVDFSAKMRFYVAKASDETELIFGDVSAPGWQFAIVEYDHVGQKMRAYLNGSDTPTEIARTGGIGTHANEFNLHNAPGSAGPSDFGLDEVGVYSAILTQTQRATLYGAGSGISNTTIANA